MKADSHDNFALDQPPAPVSWRMRTPRRDELVGPRRSGVGGCCNGPGSGSPIPVSFHGFTGLRTSSLQRVPSVPVGGDRMFIRDDEGCTGGANIWLGPRSAGPVKVSSTTQPHGVLVGRAATVNRLCGVTQRRSRSAITDALFASYRGLPALAPRGCGLSTCSPSSVADGVERRLSARLVAPAAGLGEPPGRGHRLDAFLCAG